MACGLNLGRKEPCKDVVGGIKNVYFVDFGDLGTVTEDDEITNMTGDSSNNLTPLTSQKRVVLVMSLW